MSSKRLQKTLAYIVSIVLVLAVLAYIVGGILVRQKVAAVVAQLPPSLKVTYSSLHPLLFQSAMVVKNLDIRFTPGDSAHAHHAYIPSVELEGIGLFSWFFSHKLKVRLVRLEDGAIDLDKALLDSGAVPQGLNMPFSEATFGKIQLLRMRVTRGSGLVASGNLEVDSVHIDSAMAVRFSGVTCHIADARYRIADAVVHLSNIDLDTRERTLDIDTARVIPTVGKMELGKIKSHQEDYVEGDAVGIHVSGLDFGELRSGTPRRGLEADRITVKSSRCYVFRDRRLPIEAGDKPLPMDYLRQLPVELRVQKVELGPTTFTYEEYPKDGDKTGYLKIVHFTGHIDHLINHPRPGDPAYIDVYTEGSLMGSGAVDATTRMPLRAGDPYIVEGSFHDLDVTSLNPSAENLGHLHLESGLINNLSFSFKLTAEKASGQIIGEYHNLVADKLKTSNGKTDKLKSFFLKHVIIPKDKDRSLPVARRTGKVDYKRDPSRYFSYYLLHALLTGVKGSFSLGFLLPG